MRLQLSSFIVLQAAFQNGKPGWYDYSALEENGGRSKVSYIALMATSNLSTRRIPGMLIQAVVIPLPKPGKKPDDGGSYRIVALLSPVERISLPVIREAVPLPDFQHGCRKVYSSTTALCKITKSWRSGLNRKRSLERAMIAALDLKRAVGTVNHELLHQLILKLELPEVVKIWLYGYLTGREQRTKSEEELSNNIRRHCCWVGTYVICLLPKTHKFR